MFCLPSLNTSMGCITMMDCVCSRLNTSPGSRIARPNVCLKLSELGLADRAWDYEQNRRIVLEAIDIFGVSRYMFASNFPVSGLRIGFDALYRAYKAMVADFGEREQLALFHDNAKRFYRL